jgi:hypothetical protein
LEVDVLNKDPTADPKNAQAEGSMCLRVELEGAVHCIPPPASPAKEWLVKPRPAIEKTKPTGGKGGDAMN